MRSIRSLSFVLAVTFSLAELSAASGWLGWRGPNQNGKSSAKVSLPDSLNLEGKEHRWTYPVRGAGTPVAADGRVYAFGFYGETEDVEETLLFLDAETGKKIWEYRFADYISDIAHHGYAIGAPAIDPETGNIYVEASNELVMALSSDAWTIEAKQKKVHKQGASGVFAFTPQCLKCVFIDNISISSNN